MDIDKCFELAELSENQEKLCINLGLSYRELAAFLTYNLPAGRARSIALTKLEGSWLFSLQALTPQKDLQPPVK